MSFASLPQLETAARWQLAFDHRCQLGESPTWCDRRQALIWVDIPGQQALSAHAGSRQVEAWDLPQTPGCIAFSPIHGFVLALRDGVYLSDDWGGTLRKVWAFDPAASRLRLNDGRLDPQGRFWVGSYSDARETTAELFCLDLSSGLVLAHHAGFAASNGLAFSESRRTWADTARHNFHLYPLEPISPAMPLHTLRFSLKPDGWSFSGDGSHLSSYAGRPDGACVDGQGHFWVAMFEGGRVLKVDAEGVVLRQIQTPVQRPTMPCCVQGTLYLTTARGPAGSVEEQAQPLAGCVFKLEL